ncbi:MAG TPA: hypothetical protein VF064_09985 [Pyrinomonadaceae bacterium]
MQKIVALALASLFLFHLAPVALASAPRAPQDGALHQEIPLTNKEVYAMVKAKIAPEVIVAKIESSRCHFETAPNVLAEMRYNGVPDSVLMAMVKAPYGRPAPAPATAPKTRPAPQTADEPETFEGPTALLAEGTELTVTPTEEINSKTATEGQVVTFRVVNDVVIDGHTVIPEGAIARGTVVNVEGRGMLGKAGKLAVRVDSVKAVDGQKVRLRAQQAKQGGSNTGKVIALSLLVTPLFLLMRGNTARIKPGQHILVYTDEGKRVGVRDRAVEAK